MKHLFQTVIDQSALQREQIYISGGQRGMQIIIAVKDLVAMTNAKVTSVIHD